MADGGTTYPTDSGGLSAWGLYDGTNFYFPSSAARVGATHAGGLLLAQAGYAWDGTVWRRVLIDTSGRVIAVGAAAHDAAAAGNPVRIAGVYRATPPAVTDGDVVDLLADAAGRPQVDVVRFAGTAAPTPRTPADAASGVSALPIDGQLGVFNGSTWDRMRSVGAGDGAATGVAAAGLYYFNGSTWDRWRGPTVEQTALASAARTATTTANLTLRGTGFVLFVLRITAASGTGGLKLRLGLGNASYLVYTHSAAYPTTAITSTGRFGFLFGPGLREVAPSSGASGEINQHANTLAIRDVQLAITHDDGSSYTYQVTYWEV